MRKLINRSSLLLLALIFLFSCNKKVGNNNFDIPLPGFETQFTELNVDPTKDSTYTFDNGTSITIKQESLLDSLNNVINEPLVLRFRQFDNALSIYLSGLPMNYDFGDQKMNLKTAGMFELRGKYKGGNIKVNADKPIKVNIGSFYDDPRQGFFNLDDETKRWNLIDIPEAKINPEVEIIKQKLTKLKPKWKLPLGPEFYTLSYGRMADIFLGDDYRRIYKANMKALANKMAGYGVSQLPVPSAYKNIKYRGNNYDVAEMLWKGEKGIVVPKWVKKLNSWYYNESESKYYDQLEWIKLSGNTYLFKATDLAKNKKWSVKLELVSHLRYLVNYTPEQLLAKQAEIEKEIQENEEKLKRMRLIEYTVNIYSMGIFNCDRPILFQQGKPILAVKLNDKTITKDDIHRLTIFNEDLSSYANPTSMKPLTAAFFKGTNKIVLVTKSGDIGLFTGTDFMKIDSLKIRNSETLNLALAKIDVKDEMELKVLLEE